MRLLGICFRYTDNEGAQWFSGRVLDSRQKGRGFVPHRRHCVVSLSKNINPSLVLVLPRKSRPFIDGTKESNQTKQNKQTQMMIPLVTRLWLCSPICVITVMR